MQVTQSDIDLELDALVGEAPDGEPLDPLTALFVEVGTCASAMTLDTVGARRAMSRALAAGATVAQLQEVVTLVSTMGVHALFESSRVLAELAGEEPPRDPGRQELWDRYVGTSRRWTSMREEIPGFLEALLRLSPEAFAAFFEFVAVPFRSSALTTVQKELVAAAVDAMPSHRYLPGMRMHVRNALALGAGGRAVRDALAIAAGAPPAHGIR